MRDHNEAGFTLLEISLVLIIIATIFGGIILGQTLIRQAQMRNAMGDVAKYTQAYNNFIAKYKSPPGDLLTAQSFWGSDTCPGSYTPAPRKATCNGDGSGKIGAGGMTVSGTTVNTTGGQDPEIFRAWQQLFESGLINGSTDSPFNGIAGSGGNLKAVIGVNVPAPSLSGAGWTVLFQTVPAGGDANHFSYLFNHVLFLGSAAANSFTYGGVLTPAEAMSIDQKMDDGIPGTGTVQPLRNTLNPNCTSSATLYNTGNKTLACSLMFITNF